MKGKTRRTYLGGPPHDLDLDAEANFRQEFARAFSNWQAVEHELTEIFVQLVDASDRLVSVAVFQSVVGFRARIDMIDEAILAHSLRFKIQKKWTTLKGAIKRRSTRRNQLAHWGYLYGPNRRTGKYEPIMAPYGQYSPNDIVTKAKVSEWADSFLQCAARLYDFRRSLGPIKQFGELIELPPSPYYDGPRSSTP